jgi:capsular exopolysaccharide synthesis family protein
MANPASEKSAVFKFLEGQGATFDFQRYIFLIRRRFWLLSLVVALGLLFTGIWLFRQPKVYASRAVIQIGQQEEKVLGSKVEDVQQNDLSQGDFLETFRQSFTSNTVLLDVVNTLNLRKDPFLFPDVDKGTTYTDPMIADAMREHVLVLLRRDTRLIDIMAEHTDPEKARDIAAGVVTAYLKQTYQLQFKTLSAATQFLQDEAVKLKTKLEGSERQLQAYKEQHNAVSLESSQDIITAKLKELNNRAIEAKNNRIRLESDIDELRKIPTGDTERMLQIGSVAAITQVSDAHTLVLKAEAELAGLQKRYLPLHPKYIAAVTQIQRLKQSLQESLRDASKILETQYTAAKESENKLNEALQEQEKAELELSKLAIPYNTLQREVDSDKAMYDALNARIRETSVSQGIEKSPFRLIEEPLVASKPAKPEVAKDLGVALALSVAVGLALIILQDIFDDTLRSVDQAEEFLGLPALAVVPEDSRKGDKLRSAFESKDSREGEAFRTLRASLSLLGTDDSARRVFLITSAVPSEGKSFSSLSLAHSFAMNGYRTVLIEGDMRRPSFHTVFKGMVTRETPGLTDVLSRNRKLEEVLVPTPYENLNIVFAGSAAPNPSELLSGERLRQVVDELKDWFERIIIDTPPINAVSDTLTMISAAQYTCLIVRPAKTHKAAIRRAIHLIHKANGVFAGFVLNRAKFHVGSGYYYYYYGNKYADKSV